MDREEAIATIVRATQWLTTSPQTHSGTSTGGTYTVKVSAATHDLKTGQMGVHFENSNQFLQNGRPDQMSSIRLVDHADRTSYRDSVPVTYAPHLKDDPRLGRNDKVGIDIFALRQFSDEQLARMAKNAQRILQEYGQS